MNGARRWIRVPLAVAAVALTAVALTLVAGVRPSGAQDPEADAVLAVVQRLFDGMRAADSATVRTTFHPDAVLIGTEDRDGGAVTRVSPIDAFVRAVGGATGEWDERFWDWEVRVDENLATVWTMYAFFLDGELSHCGVDAITLARADGEWRIVSLADTRRREGCETPPVDAR